MLDGERAPERRFKEENPIKGIEREIEIELAPNFNYRGFKEENPIKGIERKDLPKGKISRMGTVQRGKSHKGN